MPENPRLHPLYQIWKGMRARCTNPEHVSYHCYGGRGIAVCCEWGDYEVFFEWAIGSGYDRSLSLGRKDNDLGYSPENCRWETWKQQANNTSRNRVVEAFGVEKTVAEWGDDVRCAVPTNTLYQRLDAGWKPEQAIVEPSLRPGSRRDLTFDWYQAVAETTAIYPGKGEIGGLAYCVLGLASEAGEVAGKVKKIMRDSNGVVSKETRKAILSEASDVLWYLSALCSELGISLSKCADDNLEKLLSRKTRGVIGGSGDNR